MEISAYALFDKKAAKALSNIKLYGTGNPAIQNTVRVVVIVVLAVLALLIPGVYKDGSRIASLLLGVCLAFLLLIPLLHITLPIRIFRNMPKDKDSKNGFTFFEKDFLLSSTSENMKSESRINYAMLHKVRETKTHFLLFPTQNSAYLVDKSSMSEDEIPALRRVLQEATGTKYALCHH